VRLLIRGGWVIDPKNHVDGIMDVSISGGIVEKVDRKISGAGKETQVIDASGLLVAPGLVDIHTHLREPGYEYKETIRTGTAAAVKGGFTTIVCMANTNPVNDNKSVTEYILKKTSSEASCRVFPCGAITKGLKGEELAEIGEMAAAGIVALSDDGKSVRNAELFRKALEYARLFRLPLISHCEDDDLSKGFVNEGHSSLLTGLEAIPTIAEEVIVLRDMAIARYLDSPIHLTHMSAKGSVEAIRQAKKRYKKITADTCPHYFTLTDEATLGFDTSTKVNPPLRSKDDMEAIREGLRNNTIDVIATDHAPHDQTSKDVEFDIAAFGISGLETALPLSLGLVRDGVLDLMGLLRKMTEVPASIVGLPYGTLTPGSAADLCLFDPEMEWTVDRKAFVSKGKNTPFDGWRVKGRNLLTIVGGVVAYKDHLFKG
jgi:dihydroorotase